jgi:short-subunit dehydrogenase
MGASHGIPMMANAGATKAYVHSLGEALNIELAPHGVHVTVVIAGPTDTPVIARFGLDPTTMPLKPLSVARSVDEALRALDKNRAHVTPGRLLRIVNAMVPASVSRRMAAKMFTEGLPRQLKP